ncbi:response regulator [Sulfitobacter delicatus]|uniref:Sensory/regulatory protein RpfC n=1 Tax=Sulfitobacter delicatus TaxID=218672 RepID=A0A1G7I3P2_9RHOB|nr:response regulator [Sulfitobacter delicatus]SDF07223.1 hypothetical protein SAMN04489759_101295 [Sulfitobacter delicatus]
MSLAQKLTEERRSRLAAERMLELKQAELFAANRKLGEHAQQLTEEIVETRAEVETIRDENQRVKSDLTAANQRIALTERRLWQSIDAIKDGFALFNGDNNLIMANRSYLHVFDGLEMVKPGINIVTILQLLTDEGIVNTGEMAPRVWRQRLIERLQQPVPESTVIRLWNGKYIKLVNQRGAGGDLVSLCLDITATVEYEEQLKEARSVAESANRAKSSFLANMSHEIRTPMNGVVGMADVLTDTGLSAEQKLYVDTIKNSGEALLVIINDVLDYSKIEARKLELHPEPFDLERIIQEILMLLQPSARDKGIDLLLDYDLFLPTQLIGDPGRLRQVLTNLIGNAVKFTARGYVLVRVTGVPGEAGGPTDVHVSIEDTGIGIPADMVGHIFGEFNQVENERNRQFDGTGLGLAISQRLIDLMGGEIWVTSEEGVGSNFGFQVALTPSGAAPLPHPTLPEGLKHVLVVDDIEANRTILERQIGHLGVSVTCCENGAQALERLDDSVDLILTDHHMPGMDGLEMTSHLRAQGNETPVIMLSSNLGAVEGNPARKHLLGLMQKPVPRQSLMARLGALAMEPSNPSQQAAPIAKAPTLQTPRQRAMRILAAEDNKTNQLVFRKMIKDLDVDLTFANNGEEAIARFRTIQPDLIFMDISMPRMDGKQATTAIRALEAKSGGHVPIVALTAHAMDGDDKGILAAGLDHYLTKPLRKPQIIERILAAHPPDARAPMPPDTEPVKETADQLDG